VKKEKVSVLFVCMGNICRSPTAQGVFENLVRSRNLQHIIEIDSAGTHAYHVGESPDSRSRSAALLRGIDLSSQRARKVAAQDFERFDLVLAMDRSNYADLARLVSSESHEKIHLFMNFSEVWDADEVPDPYYGGSQGFHQVLDMVEDASLGLLSYIESNYLVKEPLDHS
jgi:protein-tyrosine phosphatase